MISKRVKYSKQLKFFFSFFFFLLRRSANVWVWCLPFSLFFFFLMKLLTRLYVKQRVASFVTTRNLCQLLHWFINLLKYGYWITIMIIHKIPRLYALFRVFLPVDLFVFIYLSYIDKYTWFCFATILSIRSTIPMGFQQFSSIPSSIHHPKHHR